MQLAFSSVITPKYDFDFLGHAPQFTNTMYMVSEFTGDKAEIQHTISTISSFECNVKWAGMPVSPALCEDVVINIEDSGFYDYIILTSAFSNNQYKRYLKTTITTVNCFQFEAELQDLDASSTQIAASQTFGYSVEYTRTTTHAVRLKSSFSAYNSCVHEDNMCKSPVREPLDPVVAGANASIFWWAP